MRESNQIRWGVILTYIQLFLNIIISILYTPVMLRILGPAEHGLYSTVSSTVAWLSLLSLGFNASYIRFYSKYKTQKNDSGIAGLNGIFLLLFSAMGIIAIFGGIIISNNLQLIFDSGMTESEYTIAKTLTLIVTLDLALSFPASVFNSIIRAHEKFIQIKLINTLQSVMSPLITLPILLMGYGSVGMVIITTAVDLFAYSINAFYCFNKLKIKVRFNNFEKGIIKEISSFSIFIAINSIISQINSNLDKMLITRFINTTASSIYAIGFSLYSYYGSFSNAVSSMFVPRVYNIVNTFADNKTKMRKELTETFVRIGRIQYYIQMLILTGLIFFGQTFIRFWAGDTYHNSYYIAIVLCFAYTIPLCQSIGMDIQRAQNKHQLRSIVYLIMALLNVILTIILCQLYGEIGATVGTAISVLLVDVIFMNIYYHKKLNINIITFWQQIISASKGLFLPLVFGILIMIFVNITTIVSIIFWILAYTIVYIISIYLLSMNDFEKDLVLGKIIKFFRRKYNEK